MQSIDESDAWRQIPPEEKIELMNRAHASGMLAAFICIIISSTIAAALRIEAIMWGSMALSPLVFQFSSGKAWRGLKPRVMLEYLAARSAARRFAFSAGSKDLTLSLIFKGKSQQIYDRADLNDALEAASQGVKEAEMWVAVFRDTLVMIKESAGGAALEFGHILNDQIKVTSSDNGGYAASKEVIITAQLRHGGEKKFKVTSRFPGALVVFEKKVQQLQNEIQAQFEKDMRQMAPPVEGDELEEGERDIFAKF